LAPFGILLASFLSLLAPSWVYVGSIWHPWLSAPESAEHLQVTADTHVGTPGHNILLAPAIHNIAPAATTGRFNPHKRSHVGTPGHNILLCQQYTILPLLPPQDVLTPTNARTLAPLGATSCWRQQYTILPLLPPQDVLTPTNARTLAPLGTTSCWRQQYPSLSVPEFAEHLQITADILSDRTPPSKATCGTLPEAL
jgi:hypothetical protein